MSSIVRNKLKGFTIVELLIVIVVIAILAAISIIAYNGIQSRSRDAARSNAVASIKKLLELYKADEGSYPLCPTAVDDGACSDIGSSTTGLAATLVPKYAASIPNDPQLPIKRIQYARTANGAGYGLRVDYEKGLCIDGVNPNTGWGWFAGGTVPRC